MVLVQKLPFFQLLVLGNIVYDNVFYNILEGKHAFLGYKTRSLKKQKILILPKAVNPWFWSKNGRFFYFFV